MSSTRIWMNLGAVLSAGMFSLLPIETAHAQESVAFGVTQESATVDAQTGEVTISGTVTCAEPTQASIYVSVTQPIGREGAVHGGSNYADSVFFCDPDGEPYTLSLFGYDGRFGPGRAVVTVDAYEACYYWPCGEVHIQQSVRLTRR